MESKTFLELREKVIDAGYGEEIAWQESAMPSGDAFSFAQECIWVIISSGIKNQIARKIEARIIEVLDGYSSSPVSEMPLDAAFGHKGKVKAIKEILTRRESIYDNFMAYYRKLPSSLNDLLTYLEGLPFIGPTTKYHLAKNMGVNLCKPDRHLVRIANEYHTYPEALCQKLSLETGYRVATVDLIIWRAGNLGFI